MTHDVLFVRAVVSFCKLLSHPLSFPTDFLALLTIVIHFSVPSNIDLKSSMLVRMHI